MHQLILRSYQDPQNYELRTSKDLIHQSKLFKLVLEHPLLISSPRMLYLSNIFQ